MRIEKEVERDLNDLLLSVRQAGRGLRKAVETDVFEKRLAGDFLEDPTSVPGRKPRGASELLERDRFEDMPLDGNFDYWRDEESVYHVPKRALNDLIIG